MTPLVEVQGLAKQYERRGLWRAGVATQAVHDATFAIEPGETFEEVGRLRVRDGNVPVANVNEMEFVDGAIYANIWNQERIARIDPKTGVVTAWIDMSNLLTATERARGVDVLNGIAHDPKTGNFLITGKLWPWVFEVKFVKKS